ncbi:aminotransferase class V-fold PLP-dependent enzyme [Sorangium sp. So ce327]|jgi:cysteine desulfurase/selenocysteine lyase|uniref:Probable cysteine desulfurase n=1 Tax=Sorangium atrum TaxID=2995308 RepID=A0ABT5CEQ3_9BACT|nr:aminotransferase class V-fold PLP-dependent enzyme [Sorangium aterium]MDC0684915.1 aminotransferase class V-fold PLP-dependent enzyme [Sorangium aterium]
MSTAVAARSDFPALAAPGFVYLDNASTTQAPLAVIEAIAAFYRNGHANVGRGVYGLAERTTAAYEAARAQVARFLGLRHPSELVFTSGATDAINLVVEGWARRRVTAGSRVLTTVLEHHANLLPWQRLTRQHGARLETIDIDEEGRLDLDDAAAKLPGATVLAVTAISNVLGVRMPLPALAALAREHGVCMVVDAAQAVGHEPVDFAAIGCDFMALSAHKMLGPTGIGVLAARRERLLELEPVRVGGGMVREVAALGSDGPSRWREPPWGLEAGTPHIAGAIGMAAAAEYLAALGLPRIAAAEESLVRALLDGLRELEGIRVLGPGPGAARAGIVSFTFASHHPHDVAGLLGELGVAVRAGHHCAVPLMRHLGAPSTVRVSLGPYNDEGDVTALLAGLRHVTRVLA